MCVEYGTDMKLISSFGRGLKICRTLAMLALGLLLDIRAIAQPSITDEYKGEWGFSVEDQMDIKHMGQLSIHDCVGRRCQYSLMTGTDRSMCSSEGELQIHSESFASEIIAPENNSTAGDLCEVDLVRNGEDFISVSSKGSCESLCGLNALFDGDLPRLSKNRFYPASFNCYEFNSQIELAICTNRSLADLDNRLYELYDHARIASSPEGRKTLKAEQLKWLRERNRACAKSPTLTACLIDKYLNRIKQIN